MFRCIDKNGDGQLSMEEVKEGYAQHYGGRVMDDDELEEMFKAVDLNNSGFIDYTEFVAATMNCQRIRVTDALWKAFRLFDRDGSGTITCEEILSVLQGGLNQLVTDQLIDLLMRQVKQNKDV